MCARNCGLHTKWYRTENFFLSLALSKPLTSLKFKVQAFHLGSACIYRRVLLCLPARGTSYGPWSLAHSVVKSNRIESGFRSDWLTWQGWGHFYIESLNAKKCRINFSCMSEEKASWALYCICLDFGGIEKGSNECKWLCVQNKQWFQNKSKTLTNSKIWGHSNNLKS